MSGLVETPTSKYRLMVNSIGSAGAHAIRALRGLRTGSDSELASLLYRAPSVLLDNLELDKAVRLRDALSKTGIDLELLEDGVTFEAGKGEYELAIAVKDPARVLEIIEATTLLLGVDFETAKSMVLASPAVLLGRVSRATIAAARERFEKLDVDVDVSLSAAAEFDVVVESQNTYTFSSIETRFRALGVHYSHLTAHQLLATGLDMPRTEQLWSELSRTAAKVRVLNRDLQRFDIRLEHIPDSQNARQWLMDSVGMPERIALKAAARTPFILAENVSTRDMVTLLERANDVGIRAHALLIALQSFSLSLEPGGDRATSAPWVRAIAGPNAVNGFTDRCQQIPGPLSKLQARWLQAELGKCGVRARLVER